MSPRRRESNLRWRSQSEDIVAAAYRHLSRADILSRFVLFVSRTFPFCIFHPILLPRNILNFWSALAPPSLFHSKISVSSFNKYDFVKKQALIIISILWQSSFIFLKKIIDKDGSQTGAVLSVLQEQTLPQVSLLQVSLLST